MDPFPEKRRFASIPDVFHGIFEGWNVRKWLAILAGYANIVCRMKKLETIEL